MAATVFVRILRQSVSDQLCLIARGSGIWLGLSSIPHELYLQNVANLLQIMRICQLLVHITKERRGYVRCIRHIRKPVHP